MPTLSVASAVTVAFPEIVDPSVGAVIETAGGLVSDGPDDVSVTMLYAGTLKLKELPVANTSFARLKFTVASISWVW
jgi:hypothetical protein